MAVCSHCLTFFSVQIWVLNHSHRNNKIFQFCFCWTCHHSNNLSIITWVIIFNTFIRVTCQLMFHFQLCLTCCCPNIFHDSIFIFHLDKQHPCWLEILPMAELRISSFLPLSLNVLVYTSCECGCIHEDSLFSLSRLVDSTFQRADGWITYCGLMPGWISQA